jgi:hypothetical protein
MPAFVVTGPKGPESIDYGVVTASSPLGALCAVHADGLGPGRVRVDGDRLVFSSPDEQKLCAGVWRVVELARNGLAMRVEITIPSI